MHGNALRFAVTNMTSVSIDIHVFFKSKLFCIENWENERFSTQVVYVKRFIWGTYVSTLKVTTHANIIYHQINHKNHSSLSLQLYLRVMDARVWLLNNKLIVKIYIWYSPCTFTQAASIHKVKNTYTWRTSRQLIKIANNLWKSI